MNKTEILIVGAGLSGLTTAFHLQHAGKQVTVLEARQRLGGRIFGVATNNHPVRFDLGPAWFWEHHHHVQQMLQAFGLGWFKQFDDGDIMLERGPSVSAERVSANWPQPTAFRIMGGTSALIDALMERIAPNTVQLRQQVSSVIQQPDGLLCAKVSGNDHEATEWLAEQVIITLPPHLAATSLRYEPALPQAVTQAMVQTPTWMGEAMKVSLVYKRPFWRTANLSGLVVSYAGPVQQFHDATPADEGVGALFGWVGNNSSARTMSPDTRRQAVVAQAVRLFGSDAANPLHYAETNWEMEPFTTNQSATNRPLASEHPQYGHPLLQEPQMNGRLWWATTEVSSHEGGYLDGAILIGKQVANQIIEELN